MNAPPPPPFKEREREKKERRQHMLLKKPDWVVRFGSDLAQPSLSTCPGGGGYSLSPGGSGSE